MVYSFEDVAATLAGIGGAAIMGNGAAAADEGITFDFIEDKDSMTTGADGQAVHSLHASRAAKVTVRLMKTSPQNAVLSAMYNAQSQSSALWGQNILSVTNPSTGDNITCSAVAFAKHAPVTWAKDPGMNEWTFNAGYANLQLGAGIGNL
jgi:hypothetical protein